MVCELYLNTADKVAHIYVYMYLYTSFPLNQEQGKDVHTHSFYLKLY